MWIRLVYQSSIMVMVREINRQRIGYQVDGRLARLGVVTPNIAVDLGLSDVQSTESFGITSPTPAPPSTPKPSHPPAPTRGPPPRFSPELPLLNRPNHLTVPAKTAPVISRTTMTQVRQIQTVSFDYRPPHAPEPSSSLALSRFGPISDPVRSVPVQSTSTHRPKLLSVSGQHPRLLTLPARARSGTIHPSLPGDYPTIASSPIPSPLRTTAEGVRLEIAPTAMLALTRPEIAIPTSLPPLSISGGSDPELDPDI